MNIIFRNLPRFYILNYIPENVNLHEDPSSTVLVANIDTIQIETRKHNLFS